MVLVISQSVPNRVHHDPRSPAGRLSAAIPLALWTIIGKRFGYVCNAARDRRSLPSRPSSALEHAHHARRASGERVVRPPFAQHPELVFGRASELEAVARVIAALRVAADDVELEPRAARRARL